MVSKFIKHQEFFSVVYRYYRTIIIINTALAGLDQKNNRAKDHFGVFGSFMTTIGCLLRLFYSPDYRLTVAKIVSSCIFGF